MKRFAFILHILTAFVASAQQTLTLEQCQEMAQKNNVAIKNATLENRMAHELRKEAFTKYFPEVSAAGFAFTTDRSVVRYDVKGDVPLPDLPPLLPAGTELTYDFGFSLVKKGVMAGANLVQPVFMGGLIVNGNRLTEVGEAVAELQSRQSSDQVALTTQQYYWQLAVLKSKRHTLNEVIAMLDTLHRQVKVAVDAGVLLRNDLLEVELRRNQMLTAQIELDNGINVMSTLLGQYIGMGLEPVDIADTIDPDAGVTSPDGLYVDPSSALPLTTDYRLLQQNVKAAKLRHRMEIGSNLPMVGIGAGYFYQNLLDQGHGFGAIYATVAIPISGWWGGSHAIKRSSLQARKAQNELEDYGELLQIKMKNSWDDLMTSRKKLDVAQESIAQSRENLRLNENSYRAGVVTVTDLLKAQTLFRQACDQYVDSYGDYMIKTTQYLQATGR